MAISMQKARTLCTKSELDLIKWSSPQNIKTLTPARLRQKIDRARKLRDKFKDLSRKQAGEARGKRKPTGTRPAKGNERTVEKRELFEEAITRFENALSKASADETKATKSKAGAKKTKTKTKTKKKAKAIAKAPAKTGASSKKATTKTAGASKKKKSTAKKSAAKKTTAKKASKAPAKPIKIARASGTGVGGASLGGSSSASALTGLGNTASQQSREVRRQKTSKVSKGARERSRFARTSQEKIQGHVSASTRRSQAKRDSK